MRYIDHYEIEYKRRGGDWEHVGNVHPGYQWRVVRPWFLLFFFAWPKIVNNATAAALRARCQATDAALALIGGDARDQYRIWRWECRGRRLTRHIEGRFDGHLI